MTHHRQKFVRSRHARSGTLAATVMALAIMSSPGRAPAAEGEPHGIYRDSGDVNEQLPRFYCKEQANKLREQYQADQQTLRDIQKYIADHAAAMAERPYWGQQIRAEELVAKEKLKKDRAKWAQLKSRCPDIGQLDPEQADPDPASPDPKNRNGTGPGNLREEGERLLIQYESAEEAATTLASACSDCARSMKDGRHTAYSADGIIDDPTGYHNANCGARLQLLKYRAASLLAESRARTKLANDPPRDDLKAIVTVTFRQTPKPDLKKETDRWLWEATNASRKVAANIDGYTTSFERYQGAEKAGDRGAMHAQAKSMLRCAIAAEEAAVIAADRTERLETAEPPSKFDAPLNAEQKSELTKRFRDEQEALLKNGLSAEFRNALKDSGLTDDEIQTVEAEMKKQTPEEMAEKFEQRIARRKFRNELAAQEKNKRRSSHRAPPADLQEMELYARSLMEQTQRTAASPTPIK